MSATKLELPVDPITPACHGRQAHTERAMNVTQQQAYEWLAELRGSKAARNGLIAFIDAHPDATVGHEWAAGDLIQAAQGERPYYATGDRARLLWKDGDGWWADWTGNPAFYKEGEWFIHESDMLPGEPRPTTQAPASTLRAELEVLADEWDGESHTFKDEHSTAIRALIAKHYGAS
jgi:hypothetical protein